MKLHPGSATAMLQMAKLDIASLEAAAAEVPTN